MATDPTPTTPRPARRHRQDDAGAAEAAREAYITAVQREAYRLARRKRGFDADDVAQRVAEKAWKTIEEVMVKYPDPVGYARAATGNASVDHDRRESRQQCLGAYHLRTAVVLDEELVVGQVDRTRRMFIDPAEIVLGRIGADEILGLIDDDADRACLVAAGIRGDRMGEIAADRGVHHANAGRRVRNAAAVVRAVLADDGYLRTA